MNCEAMSAGASEAPSHRRYLSRHMFRDKGTCGIHDFHTHIPQGSFE